jgi:HNH endonuclease
MLPALAQDLIAHHSPLFWVLVGIGGLLALYWLPYLWLAREGLRHRLSNLLPAMVAYVAAMAYFGQQHYPIWFVLVAVAIGLVVFQLTATKRSRRTPAQHRRIAISRGYKGKPYNSSKHHIDHIVPFSRGGSHSADNLRVIPKKQNLSKGRKRPGAWELYQAILRLVFGR